MVDTLFASFTEQVLDSLADIKVWEFIGHLNIKPIFTAENLWTYRYGHIETTGRTVIEAAFKLYNKLNNDGKM